MKTLDAPSWASYASRIATCFAALHESGFMLRFSDAGEARYQTKRHSRWPASENLQRKPREKVRAVPRSESQAAPEGGFLYNLSVMARRLLIGGK